MGTSAKTRRADRQQARQTKKADIQNGDSRKEARDAKHALKSTDRAQWKAEGKSIGQSIESGTASVGDAVADGAKDVAKEIADNPEDLVS
jgi:hypothetical protein